MTNLQREKISKAIETNKLTVSVDKNTLIRIQLILIVIVCVDYILLQICRRRAENIFSNLTNFISLQAKMK